MRTWDRVGDAQRTFAVADCGYGSGSSRFAGEGERFEVRQMSFLLKQGDLTMPVTDHELARVLRVS